ncbi:MAG: alcohol dehydrogenase, class IV [uncultured archaeon A07HB70]|nr:MAG: alcohol dehydrogenase, class IV [uncultured archaeon A07HB70]
MGVDRPLVVTDAGVAGAGVLDAALAAYDGPTERLDAPTEPSTDDLTADALPNGVDGVVAVGGGSVLDTAKLAALLLTHGGTPADYLGAGAVPGPVAPLVAVPTTSGTGSQSTQTAVVHHEGVKRGVSDEHLRPARAVVDPTLTFGLPRRVTARSGFDAFVHALESLTARDHRWVPERAITYQGANPVTRPLSRRALSLVGGALERATMDGGDRAARRELSLGAHLAGLAFSNAGLGVVHALASAVGGMTDAAHGDCLAACVAPGLRYNLPVRRDAYAAVAAGLGVGTAAEDLVTEVLRLRDALALPSSVADLGLDRSDAAAVVENTLVQERRLATTPRFPDEDGADLRAAVAASVG